MTNPKVVHPATQNRIDFRNHTFDGPADMLPEDLPELCIQRCPLLQLGRVVWPPLLVKAEYAPILKSQEAEALSLLQIHHSTLVFVDRNTELRKLLTEPSAYCRHQPVTSPFGVNQDHQVSSLGESHPEALSELYVSLSTHTAPIKEPRYPSASEQTVLESDGRYYRSSVLLAEDGDATFCICAWPKRQDRG